MTMVLHDERAPGPDDCSACGAPVVRAIDELFRLLALDQAPVTDGAWVYGSEYFAGIGDAPEPSIRCRRATEADPPAPRWQLHGCVG